MGRQREQRSASPTVEVHDELIDDWLYSYGWTQVSSQDECVHSTCNCAVTGVCEQRIFNHYMVESGEVSPLTPSDSGFSTEDTKAGAVESSPFVFPIRVDLDTVEMIGVEEVRCKPHIVNTAHAYYETNVIGNRKTSTLVSVAVEGHKSTCFNMSCYLLCVARSTVPRGSLAIGQASSEECWILARGTKLTALFLESLCTIGVDPVVEKAGEMTLWPEGPEKSETEKYFETAGFLWKRGGPNMLWNPKMSSAVTACHENVWGVRAVKTALVTVSVLLTPKSMYGGKNPTTKTVNYFVHNICNGKDM